MFVELSKATSRIGWRLAALDLTELELDDAVELLRLFSELERAVATVIGQVKRAQPISSVTHLEVFLLVSKIERVLSAAQARASASPAVSRKGTSA